MKVYINLFGLSCVSLVIIFLIGMTGCSEEDAEEELVGFIQAIPASGSTIEPDTTIIATFDGTPAGVDVTSGKFSVSGVNVTITGPFPVGALDLTVTWSGGATALTYTVASEEPDIPPAPEGMVLIPGGEFEMGSEDEDAEVDEQPVHTVHVDAFYMDTHEVTNLDFRRFVLAKPQWQKDRIPNALHNGSYLRHWNGNNYPAGKANHPVVYVSWYAAMAYAKWSGKRLPTEAEWEKAARGGKSGLKYPWGNAISDRRANYNRHVGDTTVVGNYSANGYGLYDMSGNVWEWCLDAYDPDFYFSSPRNNPLSDVNTIANVNLIIEDYTNIKSYRVLRGGSWGNSARYVRCAQRGGNSPSVTDSYFGFRCARAVE